VVVRRGEAAEVRRAAARVRAGEALAAIVRDLNDRGVRTSTGAQWSVTTLRRVLLNDRHAGIATYNGDRVGVGGWPAILDSATQDAVRIVLADPARRTALTTEPKYFLSGRAKCWRCGDRVFASPMGPKGQRWMVYRCRKAHVTRRLDLVDRYVELVVLARLSRPDAADLFARDEYDLDALLAEAVELRRQLDDLSRLLVERVLTETGVREQSVRLRAQLDEIERRRATAVPDERIAALISADAVESVWRMLPLRTRRAVLDVLCEVTILPARHRGQRFGAVEDLDEFVEDFAQLIQVRWRAEEDEGAQNGSQ